MDFNKEMQDIDAQIAALQAKKAKLEKESRKNIINEKVQQFINRYSGQQLLAKYNLDYYSKWEIKGEDPNCDLGGCHSNPHLAYVEGTLEQAIEYAVETEGFYTWGGGGDIIEVKHVFTKL
jgi:hypothetical protein